MILIITDTTEHFVKKVYQEYPFTKRIIVSNLTDKEISIFKKHNYTILNLPTIQETYLQEKEKEGFTIIDTTVSFTLTNADKYDKEYKAFDAKKSYNGRI